jgi:ketosteroid isomerase-like protein
MQNGKARLSAISPRGPFADQREALEFRLTMGMRKMGGYWHITHEHHALPAI